MNYPLLSANNPSPLPTACGTGSPGKGNFYINMGHNSNEVSPFQALDVKDEQWKGAVSLIKKHPSIPNSS